MNDNETVSPIILVNTDALWRKQIQWT